MSFISFFYMIYLLYKNQIIVQSKNETETKIVYDKLMENAVIGRNKREIRMVNIWIKY